MTCNPFHKAYRARTRLSQNWSVDHRNKHSAVTLIRLTGGCGGVANLLIQRLQKGGGGKFKRRGIVEFLIQKRIFSCKWHGLAVYHYVATSGSVTWFEDRFFLRRSVSKRVGTIRARIGKLLIYLVRVVENGKLQICTGKRRIGCWPAIRSRVLWISLHNIKLGRVLKVVVKDIVNSVRT